MLKVSLIEREGLCLLKIFLGDSSSDTRIAIYQMDQESRKVVKKYPYQKNCFFHLKLLGKPKKNYIFRVYLLTKEKKTFFDTVLDFDKSLDIKLVNFIDYLKYPRNKLDLIKFINYFDDDDNFINDFVAVRNSTAISRININKIKDYYLNLLISSRLDENKNNAIKWLIYYLGTSELNHVKKIILINIDLFLSKSDFYYYKALVFYRIGDFLTAKKYNYELLKYKDDLYSSQRGGVSYIDFSDYLFSFDYVVKSIDEDTTLVNSSNSPISSESILLVSCDYGYLNAYIKDVFTSNNVYKNNIHIHVVLHSDKDVVNAYEVFSKYPEIGFSYSINPSKNKTYYSIRRYLMIPYIAKKYNKSVIICDIDININDNYDYLSSLIGADKVALMRKDGDLPWNTYLAGFNFFGKNAICRGGFLDDLISILYNLYVSGRNLWTLDQVALLLAVEKHESDDSLVYISDYLVSGIRQISNRSSYRRIASESMKILN